MNKKSLLSAFLAAILLGGLVLASVMRFETVQASTDVIGIITSDTAWTKGNSPYSLTGPLLVNWGVTLTVEPGVTVNLNDYYIQVNGTMRAIGSSTDKIRINGVSSTLPTGSKVTFTAIDKGYDEQTVSGSIIENAIVDSTRIDVVVSSVKIDNNIINGIVSAGASSIISNNIITGKVHAVGSAVVSNNTVVGEIGLRGGSASILNNTVTGGSGNGITLDLTDKALVSGNIVSDCGAVGIGVGGNGLVERNLVKNCNCGISVAYEGWIIVQNNTISDNYIGLRYATTVAMPTISYNNFAGNTYSLYVYSTVSRDINATYNWWGTTDAQAIRQSIFDAEDDFNLGTVIFTPFLTEQNPNVFSTVSPTVSPSPGPTPTPSSEPEPEPEPSPAVPVAVASVAVVAAVIAGLLVYFKKRKR